VTGLVTGLRAPQASHLLLLEAVTGAELVRNAHGATLAQRYLWHEFGESTLFLPNWPKVTKGKELRDHKSARNNIFITVLHIAG
jgi:hypothetical protein